jgi:hypothetical protein
MERNQSALVVVSSEWSERPGIRRLLAPTDSGRRVGTEEHWIVARIIDTENRRGLWIELNTRRRMSDPAIPAYRLLIPWNAVLALLYDPEQSDAGNELVKLSALDAAA